MITAKARTLSLAATAVVAVAVFAVWRTTGSATPVQSTPPEVLETVSQRDIGWDFAGWLWLEKVEPSPEFLTAEQAFNRYRATYPEIGDEEVPFREPPQLVRFVSDLVIDGVPEHPLAGLPGALDPLWAYVVDSPEPPEGSDLPPAAQAIHIIYLDARTGAYVLGFHSTKVDPSLEHPSGWRRDSPMD